MSALSLSLCNNLIPYGLRTFPENAFFVNLAFRGPCAIYPYARITRCKIDMFSYIGLYSNCCTSSIGRYTSIGENVRLGMGQHDYHAFSTSSALAESQVFAFAGYPGKCLPQYRLNRENEETSCVTVGHDVWIGANVIVPSDVIIGHGAVIGAGSTITKDVPPYSVVVGHNRIVKQRFSDEQISDLLQLEWWNYNVPEMIKNGFQLDINNPTECIQHFKDADPESLIPIPKRWMFVEFEKQPSPLNEVKLTPFEMEEFTLYFDPRHPNLPKIIRN